jgi:hypothetical protein
VVLAVDSAAVAVGQQQTVRVTGWEPGARVVLETVNEAGTVATFRYGEADTAGAVAFTVAIQEPGAWSHRIYRHPDPAVPPRDRVAALTVTAAGRAP